MARYRKIDTRIWGDGNFRALTPPQPCGQALWWYLLTNHRTTNIPGLYGAGRAAIAEELGWSTEGFAKAFAEVSSQGMAKADWNARVVWVPNAIKYNTPESPNVVRSWSVAWDEIPESELKNQAWIELKAFLEALGEAFAKAFLEACPDPSRKAIANQEQEQEQEQEKNIYPGAEPNEPAPSGPDTQTEKPNPSADTDPPAAAVVRKARDDLATSTMRAIVGDVVAYYRQVHPSKGRQLKPGHADWRRIENRVREGFTADELKRAVDGNARDPWHQQNPAGHTAEFVFRNSTKVEGFIAIASGAGPPGLVTRKGKELQAILNAPLDTFKGF